MRSASSECELKTHNIVRSEDVRRVSSCESENKSKFILIPNAGCHQVKYSNPKNDRIELRQQMAKHQVKNDVLDVAFVGLTATISPIYSPNDSTHR